MGRIANYTYQNLKNIEIRKFFSYSELLDKMKLLEPEIFRDISLCDFIKEIEEDTRFETNFNNDAVALKEWNIDDEADFMFQDPDFN